MYKAQLRELAGRLFARLESYHVAQRERLRQERLASVCQRDTSSHIGESARIINLRGDPSRITIGPNTAILGELAILPQGGQIRLGSRCFVGPGTKIWSAEAVDIGNYVLISHNVTIMDTNAHSMNWRERRYELDRILPSVELIDHPFDLNARSMAIEDDVWIGCAATVIGGVRIGRGAIVGAGTVVTKDVAPFTVVVGNPMRILKSLPQKEPLRGA